MRLRRRADFLTFRIGNAAASERRFDRQELSATLWAIEEIERWDAVAEVVLSDQSDGEKVAIVASLLRSRLRPSDADMARTPQLARNYGTVERARAVNAVDPHDGDTEV